MLVAAMGRQAALGTLVYADRFAFLKRTRIITVAIRSMHVLSAK